MDILWDDKRLTERPKRESGYRIVGGSVIMTTTTTDDGAAAVATTSPPNGHGRTPMARRPTPTAVPAAPEEEVDRRQRRSSPVTATDCTSEQRFQQSNPPLLMDVAIRCTAPSCSCDCFAPCKSHIRLCDGCGHGWVSHALDKLGFRHLFNSHQVELVQPVIAFDIASLMLYGTQAIPVRLKILLDRLFSVLRRDEVLQVLHGFGWTNEDYTRGYILQDPTGHVLDRWLMASRDEEPLILQQFLRFGETKTIAQQLLLQDNSDGPDFFSSSFFHQESDIRKLIDKSSKSAVPTAISCTVPTTKFENSNSVYSMVPTMNLPLVSKTPFRQLTSSVSSTRSLSPNISSPVTNCGSPSSSISPLNRLQNMQPYDYRGEKCSPTESQKTTNVNISTSCTALTSTVVSYSNSSSPVSPPTTLPLSVITSNALSHNVQIHQYNSNNNNSDYSGAEDDLDCLDDSSSNAINLSSSATPTNSYLDSIFAARKVRHLRKSANPMKRRWNPMVLSQLATNPATGKKRVQCNVCFKTFCDKGALKIHFSAVHLREMHKCTVEGCNMMFSSRRSRNRHSANPNPKLHTPNYRRKINPHDGRAANPYPIIPPSGLSGFGSTSFLPSSLTNHFEGDSNTITEPELEKSSNFSYSRKQEILSLDAEPNIVKTPEPKDLTMAIPHKDNDAPLQLTKKRCLDDLRNQRKTLIKPLTNGDINYSLDGGIDLSLKDTHRLSSSSAKGVRKRKSLNPTKCPVNSDDELQYVSTDDSSSDTYIDRENDENGLNDSKSDDLTSDDIDSKDDDDELDDKKLLGDLPSSCSSPTSHCSTLIKTNQTTAFSAINTNTQKILQHERQNGYPNNNNPTDEIELSSKDTNIESFHETEDITENPLRHLESLSLGAFANITGSQRSHLNRLMNKSSSGVSFHAPGLGLGSTTVANVETSRPESPQTIRDERISQYLNHGGSLISPQSTQHLGPVNSDPENSLTEQMPQHAIYRDAPSIGSLEIPVDKENPRRCTACSKIFQNHFGVKTHYQNVHLKLMHKCTVEGCNAAFPSKRSRDRHSANLNLHRKLLSTSSEKPPNSFFEKGAPPLYPYHPDALRSDFFSRLYDPQSHLPLNFAAELYHHSRLSAADGSGFLPGSQYPTHLIPGFHPAFLMPSHATPSLFSRRHSDNGGNNESGKESPISSIVSSPTTLSPKPTKQCSSSPERKPSIKLEGDLQPDTEGRYSCDICEKKFHENVVLREHYEKCHSNLLVKCKEDGCDKVFLSGQTRNIHTDEVHRKDNLSVSS